MRALCCVHRELRLDRSYPTPTPQESEALVRVLRAGICSTDFQILAGYVPDYNHVLGHEFVGVVERCTQQPSLVGKRVVGEINCPCEECTDPDPIFRRNHAPFRTVLGIINKDGTMADYCTLPVANLHLVPEGLTDEEACFAEPLAAACRVLEQQVIARGAKVAVLGDGKLGLLIAQLLVVRGVEAITHFGRHDDKLELVEGTQRCRVHSSQDTMEQYGGAFDVCIEATGSPQGVLLAAALTRPLGTLVLKSTCAIGNDASVPAWTQIANDIVVNEKMLVGSRCGPFPPALAALQDARIKSLVRAMVSGVFSLDDGMKAMEAAKAKGAIKVQLRMDTATMQQPTLLSWRERGRDKLLKKMAAELKSPSKMELPEPLP
ncbi:hypothetical protein WJX72_007687 [[Myrmecia] bisecta]|uniref:Alcohol dehydrogenase n=1 Tax=[Myrmecia] bisecta TaxID=41462 RepID=A0AAW1QRN0_9CHLO